MADLLEIGLDSWIIADGNYDDFSVGEVRSFALEYCNAEPLKQIEVGDCSMAPLGDGHYQVNARTTFVDDRWAVIDAGILAYRELHGSSQPPRQFAGDIWLGVDPFPYFERLALRSSAPPLIHDWRIHRIAVETAPRILSGGMWIFDPAKLHRSDVQTTRGTGEDFVLHCERVSNEPRKTL
jgi:hypothetical protein